MAIPETYMYSIINNRRPIILSNGTEIRSPRSIYLTKEDVYTCLKSSYVYRRFSPDHLERVNTGNVDRLHNAKFIPENEWNQESVETVVEPEEPEVENSVEVTEEVIEEAENPVFEEVEEIIEEEITTEESDPEEVAEPTSVEEEEQDVTEESVENTVSVEEEEVDTVDDTEEVRKDNSDEAVIVGDNETGVSTKTNSNQYYNTQPRKEKNYYKKQKRNK